MSQLLDLLDLPAVSDRQLDDLRQRISALLGYPGDVVLVHAEATVALEAVARSTGRPDATVVNVVSGPYGTYQGRWLAETGAKVIEIGVPFDRAVPASAVADALANHPGVALVHVVHAEAANGTVNPLDDIVAVAKAAGALVSVDAVASVGAEPLTLGGGGIDYCIIGPQKAMAGPMALSAVLVSQAGREWIESNPAAPRGSVLSLFDWAAGPLPVMPSPLEVAALDAALSRLESEGLATTVRRHRSAAVATRVALGVLGLDPWVHRADDAAAVATTARRPSDVDISADALACLASVAVTPGAGALASQLLRINHTGRRARLEVVVDAIGGLGRLLHPALASAAQDAAAAAWDGAIQTATKPIA